VIPHGTLTRQRHRSLGLDLGLGLQRPAVLDCLVAETVLPVAGSSVTTFPRILSDDLLLTTGNNKTKKNQQACQHSFHTSVLYNNGHFQSSENAISSQYADKRLSSQ